MAAAARNVRFNDVDDEADDEDDDIPPWQGSSLNVPVSLPSPPPKQGKEFVLKPRFFKESLKSLEELAKFLACVKCGKLSQSWIYMLGNCTHKYCQNCVTSAAGKPCLICKAAVSFRHPKADLFSTSLMSEIPTVYYAIARLEKMGNKKSEKKEEVKSSSPDPTQSDGIYSDDLKSPLNPFSPPKGNSFKLLPSSDSDEEEPEPDMEMGFFDKDEDDDDHAEHHHRKQTAFAAELDEEILGNTPPSSHIAPTSSPDSDSIEKASHQKLQTSKIASSNKRGSSKFSSLSPTKKIQLTFRHLASFKKKEISALAKYSTETVTVDAQKNPSAQVAIIDDEYAAVSSEQKLFKSKSDCSRIVKKGNPSLSAPQPPRYQLEGTDEKKKLSDQQQRPVKGGNKNEEGRKDVNKTPKEVLRKEFLSSSSSSKGNFLPAPDLIPHQSIRETKTVKPLPILFNKKSVESKSVRHTCAMGNRKTNSDNLNPPLSESPIKFFKCRGGIVRIFPSSEVELVAPAPTPSLKVNLMKQETDDFKTKPMRPVKQFPSATITRPMSEDDDDDFKPTPHITSRSQLRGILKQFEPPKVTECSSSMKGRNILVGPNPNTSSSISFVEAAGETMRVTAKKDSRRDTLSQAPCRAVQFVGADVNLKNSSQCRPSQKAIGRKSESNVMRVKLESDVEEFPYKRSSQDQLPVDVPSRHVGINRLTANTSQVSSSSKPITERRIATATTSDFCNNTLNIFPQEGPAVNQVMLKNALVYFNYTVESCLLEDAKRTLKLKLSDKLTSNVTHIVHHVDEDDDNNTLIHVVPFSMEYLFGLAHGMWQVSNAWIERSVKESKWLSPCAFEISGNTQDVNGASHQYPVRARINRDNGNPGLLDGFVFYLYATCGYTSSCTHEGIGLKLGKRELLTLIQGAGGKVTNREPDPNIVSSLEHPARFHANQDSRNQSPFLLTSHVILYDEKTNPPPKWKLYTMEHVKTLKSSWLIASISKFRLEDPQGFY